MFSIFINVLFIDIDVCSYFFKMPPYFILGASTVINACFYSVPCGVDWPLRPPPNVHPLSHSCPLSSLVGFNRGIVFCRHLGATLVCGLDKIPAEFVNGWLTLFIYFYQLHGSLYLLTFPFLSCDMLIICMMLC